MSYRLDLSVISVQNYQEMLINKNLLPGRRLLLTNIEQTFETIGKQDIVNLAQLKKELSTPKKMSDFSDATGISKEYLILLKREINSLLPKIISIQKLLDIDEDTCKSLSDSNIKTTEDFYDAYLSGKLSLNLELMKDLFAQCDLIRIDGIRPLAAKIFIAAGYDSCKSIANADAEDMLCRIHTANEKGAFYTGKLGLKDMLFCIDNAKFLVKYTS